MNTADPGDRNRDHTRRAAGAGQARNGRQARKATGDPTQDSAEVADGQRRETRKGSPIARKARQAATDSAEVGQGDGGVGCGVAGGRNRSVDVHIGVVGADAVRGGHALGAGCEIPDVLDSKDVEVLSDVESVGGGAGVDTAHSGDRNGDHARRAAGAGTTRNRRETRDGRQPGEGSGDATEDPAEVRQGRQTRQRSAATRSAGVAGSRETRHGRQAATDSAEVRQGDGGVRCRGSSGGNRGVDVDVRVVGADAVRRGHALGAGGEIPDVLHSEDVQVLSDVESVGGGAGVDTAHSGDRNGDHTRRARGSTSARKTRNRRQARQGAGQTAEDPAEVTDGQ